MTTSPAPLHELSLTRLIDAPPELVFRCWTEPELLKQWFCPLPWTTPEVETDVRPGGVGRFLMRGPDGEEQDVRGVYLEVIPGRKIVSTDAYSRAWEPSAKPYVTIVLTFDPEGGKTRYLARVLHWSAEDKAAHEAIGFHSGWGTATDQLEALVKRLQA
jgi:uncharacterized protein YndB with AHSA1/START domain